MLLEKRLFNTTSKHTLAKDFFLPLNVYVSASNMGNWFTSVDISSSILTYIT